MTGEELRIRRERLGISQAQLAIALQRPLDSIQNWEQGRRAIPMPGVLRFVLDALTACAGAYRHDRAGFIAFLPRFLSSDCPPRTDP